MEPYKTDISFRMTSAIQDLIILAIATFNKYNRLIRTYDLLSHTIGRTTRSSSYVCICVKYFSQERGPQFRVTIKFCTDYLSPVTMWFTKTFVLYYCALSENLVCVFHIWQGFPYVGGKMLRLNTFKRLNGINKTCGWCYAIAVVSYFTEWSIE